MDEDATWYRSRPRLRPHCARQGPISTAKAAQHLPLFSAHVYCGHAVAYLSDCWALVNLVGVYTFIKWNIWRTSFHSAAWGRVWQWRIARRKHLLFSISLVHWQALRWTSTIISIRNFLDVSTAASLSVLKLFDIFNQYVPIISCGSCTYSDWLLAFVRVLVDGQVTGLVHASGHFWEP